MKSASLSVDVLSQIYASLAELAAYQKKAGESDKRNETKSLMAASVVALGMAKITPGSETASVEDVARKDAWNRLKPELGTTSWSVIEHFNFEGFFMWGWSYAMRYKPTLERVAYKSFETWSASYKFSDLSSARLPLYHLEDLKAAFEAGALTGTTYAVSTPGFGLANCVQDSREAPRKVDTAAVPAIGEPDGTSSTAK